MAMRNNNRTSWLFFLILLIFFLGGGCLVISVFAFGVDHSDLQQSIPISIQSEENADYSPDTINYAPKIVLNIVEDIIRDETSENQYLLERINKALAQLDTPIPSITLEISYTPTLTFTPTYTKTYTNTPTKTSTSTRTPFPSRTPFYTPTKIPPSATHTDTPRFTDTQSPSFTPSPTDSQIISLPPTDTQIPAPTGTHTQIPPTETSTETSLPTFTPSPTDTSTPIPTPTDNLTTYIEIVVPTNGQIISNIDQTNFEAEAWVGSTRINGNNIERIEFKIEAIGFQREERIVRYCAFKGDNSCLVMENDTWAKMSNGSYTFKARALNAITGEFTNWVSVTFEVQK